MARAAMQGQMSNPEWLQHNVGKHDDPVSVIVDYSIELADRMLAALGVVDHLAQEAGTQEKTEPPFCEICNTSAKMVLHGTEWLCHGTHRRDLAPLKERFSWFFNRRCCMPCGPDTLVDVVFRNGVRATSPRPAKEWSWSDNGFAKDIALWLPVENGWTPEPGVDGWIHHERWFSPPDITEVAGVICRDGREFSSTPGMPAFFSSADMWNHTSPRRELHIIAWRRNE